MDMHPAKSRQALPGCHMLAQAWFFKQLGGEIFRARIELYRTPMNYCHPAEAAAPKNRACDSADDGSRRRVARFDIQASVSPRIGFASHQNAVPLLRELVVVSAAEAPVESLSLRLSADPPFVQEKTWQIDRLCPGDSIQITDRSIVLNAAFLCDVGERIVGDVILELVAPDGSRLAHLVRPVELLAHNEWGGLGAMAELLPAFVMPNDPAVDHVLKAASEVLRRAGRPHGMDGYAARQRDRVWDIASAIWSAVAGLRLTYALPPASFEQVGQKVRTPGGERREGAENERADRH
jgi:hypothetical protein